MVFLDLERAYDKVPREVLWRCLEASIVLVTYTRVFKEMFEGARTRVTTVRGDSEHFSVLMVLHKVSALSPFIFALTMDKHSRHIQEEVSAELHLLLKLLYLLLQIQQHQIRKHAVSSRVPLLQCSNFLLILKDIYHILSLRSNGCSD